MELVADNLEKKKKGCFRHSFPPAELGRDSGMRVSILQEIKARPRKWVERAV